jgi:hypothetical protein
MILKNVQYAGQIVSFVGHISSPFLFFHRLIVDATAVAICASMDIATPVRLHKRVKFWSLDHHSTQKKQKTSSSIPFLNGCALLHSKQQNFLHQSILFSLVVGGKPTRAVPATR